ncbi:thioredoxin-like protein [Coniophora puteana RWD-64-598 SS2]|uniref:Thioredoxin-like protein n=1 Tax=Coniophora puteana (strain RWD-64-598) TaxID=741705 RepID=A0A5M3M7Y6_CONPW|nr:thioredoxin-like protein [Coniophora puteana RWD-64-598 SS2]EIW75392.1 thioredoxin-like protein [Coniophora puteana RWD-64-598 SS2]
MPEQLTHYGSKFSGYAHKTGIALEEAKAQYTHVEIDFTNKPDWFVSINPAGKIPAIVYGGAAAPADKPSPESTKLAESAVLLEFIADLYPDSGLMPSDPVQRAKVRFFNNTVDTVLTPALFGWMVGGAPASTIVDAFKKIQELLPENGQFAVGDRFTIADASVAPLYVRIVLLAEKGLPGKEQAAGVLEALSSPELAKFKAYGDRLAERPSVISAWDKEKSLAYLTMAIQGAKAAK